MVSFDDGDTHTTEVKLVRTSEGVDLDKLTDVHEICKEVVRHYRGVDDAMRRLDKIMSRKPHYGPWVIVVVYGLASACVGPIAFGARPIDLPIAFLLGSLLGIMQIIIAPKSQLYSNVFEISAAVLTSFLARAFGSLKGGHLFCFSALAQSAIALILPGYTVRTLLLPYSLPIHPLTSLQCAAHSSFNPVTSSLALFGWFTLSFIPFSSATASPSALHSTEVLMRMPPQMSPAKAPCQPGTPSCSYHYSPSVSLSSTRASGGRSMCPS